MDTLEAVRERCQIVYNYVRLGKSAHWMLHKEDKLPTVAEYVVQLLRRDYQGCVDQVPPHSRCRHHPPDYLAKLSNTQRVDLIVYSALLDAGAGDQWQYASPTDGRRYDRSEGIARAVQDMFDGGFFERNLEDVTVEDLEQAFQSSSKNPMAGLESRVQMLRALGRQLEQERTVFPNGRPSDLLMHRAKYDNVSDFFTHVIVKGFGPLINAPRGDVWLHRQLAMDIPFHKLLQWLMLSVLDAAHIHFDRDPNLMGLTALAEYRNGGLFIDLGVLEPKFEINANCHGLGDECIVEWRACTVVLVDKLLRVLHAEPYNLGDMTLPQLLECGTWKAGRELAALLRPTTKGPPLTLNLQGNVF